MATKKADPAQDLELLLPDHTFTCALGDVDVICFPFGLWRKAIAIYNRRAPIFAGGEDAAGMLLAEDGEALEDLAELALLACPALTREQLDSLPGNEAIALFFRVLEVNASFFMGAMTKGAQAVGKAFQGVGGASSKALSATDTDGQK